MRVDGHHSRAPDTCLLRPQESLTILCKLMRLASGWGLVIKIQGMIRGSEFPAPHLTSGETRGQKVTPDSVTDGQWAAHTATSLPSLHTL